MNLTSKQLEEAIIFATEKHKGQTRKGDGKPYIIHPMSVMLTLLSVKKSKNNFLLAAACVLHDTVEDTDATVDEIASKFSYTLASIVSELTSDEEEIARIGKKVYLANKMVNMSSYALGIKLADRYDNLADVDNVKHVNKIEETKYILNELKTRRKLTKTHQKLIKMIESRIK